jgi:hypothetical protein
VGPYVLGNRNGAWGEAGLDQSKTKVSYFILDTNKGTHAGFSSKQDLEEAAAKLRSQGSCFLFRHSLALSGL